MRQNGLTVKTTWKRDCASLTFWHTGNAIDSSNYFKFKNEGLGMDGLSLLCILVLVLLFSALPLLGVVTVILAATLEGFWANSIHLPWSVANLMSFTFVLGYGLRLLLNPYDRYVKPLLWPLLILGIGLSFSIFLSLNPFDALRTYIRLIFYLGTCYFISLTFSRLRDYQLLMNTLFLSLIVSLLLALGQWWSRETGMPLRLYAGFTDWNYFPIQVSLILPFLFMKIENTSRQGYKPFFIALTLLAILFALAAKSRSGTAILILTLVFWSIHREWFRRRIKVFFSRKWVPSATAAVLILCVFLFSGRIQAWAESPRLQERIFNTFLMMEVFFRNPLTGIGIGQYAAYVEWMNPALLYPVSSSHSSLFALLAETGLMGAITWVSLYIFIWLRVMDLYRWKQQDSFDTAIFCSLAVCAAASIFYAVHNHLFTWCILGILYNLLIRETGEAEPRKIPPYVIYKVDKRLAMGD